MKLYLDTADYLLIQECAKTGLIDGITTNPTNLAKQGGNPREVVEKIFEVLPHGIISLEVTEKDPEKLYAQARALAKVKDTVLVKIPCHLLYYPVIKKLVSEGIKLNITLVFSVAQAMWMAKLGVHTISPFVGRLEEIGQNGSDFLTAVCALRNQYGFKTEILAASLRTVAHVERALLCGVDAITISPKLFQEVTQHELTDKGMAQFEHDWKALGNNTLWP
jgi:transaldolase